MNTLITGVEIIVGLLIAIGSIALVVFVAGALCLLNRKCRQRYEWPIGYEAGRKPGITYSAEGDTQ